MTTAKWIKKQLSFGMNNINDLEDLKNHIQMILTRLELSPLEHIEQLETNEKIYKKYYELVNAIPDKVSGENQHERALRYIKQYQILVDKELEKSQ